MAASAAMYSAIAYSAFGIVDITIAGVQSSKIIAAGLAAYNIFGAAVAAISWNYGGLNRMGTILRTFKAERNS